MRTRLGPTAVAVLAAVTLGFFVSGCGEKTGKDAAADKDEMIQQQLTGLKKVAIDCDSIDKYLPPTTPDLEAPIEISLDRSGDSLIVDPWVSVVERGQKLQWKSDSLVWAVMFTQQQSPFGLQRQPFRGTGEGPNTPPVPSGTDANVPEDADCGHYYYIVSAYHPDAPEKIYIADPPEYVE